MKVDKVLEVFKNLVLKAKSLSRAQAIAAVTAAAVAVGGVGTGSYFIYENSHQPQETVADAVQGIETETETESGEVPSEELEEVIIADVVVVTDETEAAEAEETVLTLVATSLEKDLKIKIQDQNSRLVTGASFVVDVAENKNGARTTSYEDDDKDGIIYIDDIKAGNYRVVLEEIEGYTIKTGTITVTVKDQLEYKRIDVAAEIKSESEVNAAIEDTAVNNVPVEAELTDTLPLLESTVTTTTVGKDQVDTSNFTAASASGEHSVTVKKEGVTSDSETKDTESSGSEKPGTSETEDGSENTDPTEPDTKPTEPDTKPTEPDTSDNDDDDNNNDSSEGNNSEESSEKEEDSSDSEMLSESETFAASIERNSVSRVATASNEVTAKVSLPTRITMYYGGNPQSTTYTVTPVITGEQSIIKSIEWSACTNPDAFSVTKGSGYSMTVSYTGNGYGEGNIAATVKYDNGKGGLGTAELQITVAIVQMTDATTVLKDKSGNTLYLDEKATRQATLKDYGSASVFYTAPQYTGWQTLDGKVYYYDANHNAVTGNQVIGGVTYTFAEDGSLTQSSGSRGIDVSKYQGSIDWGAVAASGISFAIIRVGYRGASTGALIEDPYFRSNIAGATRAGIKVGVYFFTQAVNEAEAVEEASMVLSLISGYRVTYPVFIDTESATNGRANGLDTATRTAVVRAFCQTIANGGYKAGIYASKNWYNTKLNASALSNYCIWVAQYNTSCTYSGKYDMWQYTSSGSVPGINGKVDMDISYMNY